MLRLYGEVIMECHYNSHFHFPYSVTLKEDFVNVTPFSENLNLKVCWFLYPGEIMYTSIFKFLPYSYLIPHFIEHAKLSFLKLMSKQLSWVQRLCLCRACLIYSIVINETLLDLKHIKHFAGTNFVAFKNCFLSLSKLFTMLGHVIYNMKVVWHKQG